MIYYVYYYLYLFMVPSMQLGSCHNITSLKHFKEGIPFVLTAFKLQLEMETGYGLSPDENSQYTTSVLGPLSVQKLPEITKPQCHSASCQTELNGSHLSGLEAKMNEMMGVMKQLSILKETDRFKSLMNDYYGKKRTYS